MQDALDFSGRTALVVGGSSGIGNAIAQAFRMAGATTHVWGTRRSADDYAGEPGSDLSGLAYRQVDMADADALDRIDPGFDRLDILVLSQGIVRYKRAEFAMEGFREVVEVNLMSVMACATRFRPMLASSKGALVMVSSTAGFHATKGNPGYAASKAGVVGLVRTLGQAWAPEGVRVNGIAPGFVATKITRVTTENPERLRATVERIPLGRLGLPGEMAGLALFLASPLSSYVVGQTIIADGGLIL